MVIEPSLSSYLPIAGEKTYFPRVLALWEMQTVSLWFELGSPSPFPMTLNITLWAPSAICIYLRLGRYVYIYLIPSAHIFMLTFTYLSYNVWPSRLGLQNTPIACLHAVGVISKQSDSKAPVILELWRMWSSSSLSSLPGPLWPRMVAPDGVLSAYLC